jgi:hypothetical protein
MGRSIGERSRTAAALQQGMVGSGRRDQGTMVGDPARGQGSGAGIALRSNLAPEGEAIVMPRGQLLRQVRDIPIQAAGFGGRLSPLRKDARIEKTGHRFSMETQLPRNRPTTDTSRV